MAKRKTYITPSVTVQEMESELLQFTSGVKVDGKKEGDVEEDWDPNGWGQND